MRLLICILLGLAFHWQSAPAQSLKMAFYNVENLFHPSIDSINPDTEFSPNGSKNWDTAKYYTKLNRISKVILALSDDAMQSPALVGFAEIESAQVLNDLLKRPALHKIDYQWVHYDSPDRRGIDVGLIYRKSELLLLSSEVLAYHNPLEPDYKSRDILYARFKRNNGDTLNIFVCHWPSRYGGKEQSAPRRLAAAHILASKVIALGKKAKVVVMGDFNDEPQDQSIQELREEAKLKSLMADLDESWGSHRFRGDWAYLDQFIISENMLPQLKACDIYKADFLLTEDQRYPGKVVYRSFKGNFFSGGFSDHLPIYLIIK